MLETVYYYSLLFLNTMGITWKCPKRECYLPSNKYILLIQNNNPEVSDAQFNTVLTCEGKHFRIQTNPKVSLRRFHTVFFGTLKLFFMKKSTKCILVFMYLCTSLLQAVDKMI